MTKAAIFSLLFLSFTACLPAAEPNAAQYVAICNRAKLMNSDAAGQAYEGSLNDIIVAALQNALAPCAAKSQPPYTLSLVFLIAKDGKVTHVYAEPGQAASECAAGNFKGLKFPKPPKPDWLVMVSINIKPQPQP